MQQDNVTVTLAVGTAPWQKTLAASLLAAGMLRRLLTSGPYLEIQDPNGNGSLHEIKRFPLNRIVNGVLWGAWRRLPKGWRPRSPVMVSVVMKDELWSRWIPPCSVFHGWMGQSRQNPSEHDCPSQSVNLGLGYSPWSDTTLP